MRKILLSENEGMLNFVTAMAGVVGKKILKLFFKKWDGVAWTGLT